MVLREAACEDCERRVNSFERTILKTVLYTPRVHLGVRRKRRKRAEEEIALQGQVGGKDITVTLPVAEAPAVLFLLNLGPPGILAQRPTHVADVRGAWFVHLKGPLVPQGFTSLASPILDTFKFCQFLAKIAHCFATDVLGDEFKPMLLDLIRNEPRDARYDLVGGTLLNEPATGNLHELALESRKVESASYVVVKIRLFASLGAPTYLVVAGQRA